jgi:hypothetical protein
MNSTECGLSGQSIDQASATARFIRVVDCLTAFSSFSKALAVLELLLDRPGLFTDSQVGRQISGSLACGIRARQSLAGSGEF